MAPIDRSSEEWSGGYIYAIIGSVASVGLILVVIKCACCRRTKQTEGQVSSLLYDMRDATVLPPPTMSDDEVGMEEIDLNDDQTHKSTTLKADRSTYEGPKSRGHYLYLDNPSNHDVSRTAKDDDDGNSRTALAYSMPGRKATKNKNKMTSSKKNGGSSGFTAHDMSWSWSFCPEQRQESDKKKRIDGPSQGATRALAKTEEVFDKKWIGNTRWIGNTAPNVLPKGTVLSARGTKLSVKDLLDPKNKNGRQTDEENKMIENTSVSCRIGAASPMTSRKSPMASVSMRVNQ